MSGCEIDRLRVVVDAARALIEADQLMTDDASSKFDDLVAAVAACTSPWPTPTGEQAAEFECQLAAIAAAERGADAHREVRP